MSEEHIIGSGMTEQNLRLASWWVRHGISLRNSAYLMLIVLCGGMWAFVLWTLLDSYVISYPRESNIIKHVAQNQIDMNTLKALVAKSSIE